MQTVPWIVILSVLCGVLLAALAWTLKPARKPVAKPLPTEWALTARPVFSTDERRVYRLLREALPHHIVLSKLPLVRFCQPNDPNEVRYWYDLLGAHHVAFAVCSANGRVLAAIDLDTDRNNSRRVLQIKQSVLAACRVRYLRCPVDNPPTVAELQLLVPQNGSAPRAPLARRGATAGEHRLGTRHTGHDRRAPPRRAHRAVAGLGLLSGFVLRPRQPRRLRQHRVRRAAGREPAPPCTGSAAARR